MKAVEARGLSQRFGRRAALAGIDLDLESGDSLAVLGENGAGKTTLLRLLATAARPAAGELRIFGLDARSQRGEIRRRIGYLGHGAGLYPPLTAQENLLFFCDLHGLDHRRAAEMLARVGLAGSASKRAGELSRGMAQRLGLARALLHLPDMLLLDEPDAGLDAEGRALLGEFAKGRTLVMATHDAALAAEVCRRSLRLRNGRLEEAAARLEVVG